MPIVTHKSERDLSDARLAAGDKQERDVAYYLRRAFADSEEFFVFNDFSFSYMGENAQIDHLVVHKMGFAILESKSIHGEVKVNKQGEWSRSYQGNWAGIPSPIKQAEMQKTLLKAVLRDRAEEFIGKFFGMQQGVGGRRWNTFCVVSNNCILHRDDIPEEINKQVIKSESIAEAVKSLTVRKGWLDSAPAFSKKELESIVNFLLNEVGDRSGDDKSKAGGKEIVEPAVVERTNVAVTPLVGGENGQIKCKKCGEQERLLGQYGRFGYYVKCVACDTNTSMKMPCLKCGSTNMRVTKSKDEYFANCSCSEPYLLFKQTQGVEVSE